MAANVIVVHICSIRSRKLINQICHLLLIMTNLQIADRGKGILGVKMLPFTPISQELY